MRFLSAAMVVVCGMFTAAYADEPAFVTGRPGNTESPISVPAGYFQVETELGSYSHDDQSGVKTHGYSLAATDFRYGLAHGWDAEVIVQPYLSQTVEAAGVQDTQSGFGDVTLRTRRTLMGQDGDGPALAVIGFVTLPTAADGLGENEVQGGAIVTGVVALSKSLSLTGTASAATADYNDGRQGEYSVGANLSYAINDKLGCYGELFAQRDQHDTKTAATFDLGGTYLLNSVTQLDAGVNLGITDAADDVDVFVGWSHRF